MKLILITLVAVVMGMMIACSSEPTATPPPAFSDAEAIGPVKQHLRAPGMDQECGWLAEDATGWKVTQDKSNPDKYLVKAKDDSNGEEVSWTFVGSRLQVITTSKSSTNAGDLGC